MEEGMGGIRGEGGGRAGRRKGLGREEGRGGGREQGGGERGREEGTGSKRSDPKSDQKAY
jgi:hypothetical protein